MPDATSAPAIERELRFTPGDLEQFAAASGDRNPLHLDPEFARRTPYGACVVHGALASIGLLGLIPNEELARIRLVRCWFPGAVVPDSECAARATPSSRRAGAWEASLSARGKVLVRVVAETKGGVFAGRESISARSNASGRGRRMRAMPAEPSAGELRVGQSVAGDYSAGAELDAVARRHGAERLDRALLEGLAWASYVVGMELPGRESLFAGATLAAAGEPANADSSAARHSISIRELDQRTGQLILEGALLDRGGAARCVAVIEAFERAPIWGPDPGALGISGPLPERRGAVVVVGASRGFGASLTLSLLARGFDVHAAYAASAESAAALARLAGAFEPRLHLHRLDARDELGLRPMVDAVRATDAPLVGVVLSAAPPPLSMGFTADSGGELADYVADSLRLAAVPLGALLPILEPSSGWILFCSSSAITAPPRDWPHYVTAKAAVEGLARWVAAATPNARTVVIRPPAMRTDLTNTPSGRIAAVAPESVANWIVDRVASGELPVGFSLLEPELAPAEASATEQTGPAS